MSAPAVAPDLRGLLRDVSTLREDQENLRLHDGKSIDAIVRSLETFGQQKPVIIAADGTVLAGNGMYRAAKVLGWRQVACVTFSGSRDEALAYAIADNRTAERSRWNTGRLQREIVELLALDEDVVNALGFSTNEIARMEANLKSVEPVELPPEGDDTSGSERPQAPPAILTTLLTFAGDQPEIEQWYQFLTALRDTYPDAPTVGARLCAFVESLTDEQ